MGLGMDTKYAYVAVGLDGHRDRPEHWEESLVDATVHDNGDYVGHQDDNISWNATSIFEGKTKHMTAFETGNNINYRVSRLSIILW